MVPAWQMQNFRTVSENVWYRRTARAASSECQAHLKIEVLSVFSGGIVWISFFLSFFSLFIMGGRFTINILPWCPFEKKPASKIGKKIT